MFGGNDIDQVNKNKLSLSYNESLENGCKETQIPATNMQRTILNIKTRLKFDDVMKQFNVKLIKLESDKEHLLLDGTMIRFWGDYCLLVASSSSLQRIRVIDFAQLGLTWRLELILKRI